MFGLGRWLAHAPGIVFVTSASYLMIVYGFGDGPEFLAVPGEQLRSRPRASRRGCPWR